MSAADVKNLVMADRQSKTAGLLLFSLLSLSVLGKATEYDDETLVVSSWFIISVCMIDFYLTKRRRVVYCRKRNTNKHIVRFVFALLNPFPMASHLARRFRLHVSTVFELLSFFNFLIKDKKKRTFFSFFFIGNNTLSFHS